MDENISHLMTLLQTDNSHFMKLAQRK